MFTDSSFNSLNKVVFSIAFVENQHNWDAIMLQNLVHFPHFRFVVGIEALAIFIGKNPITKLSGKKTYGKRVSSSVLVGNDLLLSHQ